MSLKFGECYKCPPKSGIKKLFGDGVCAHHLAHPEDDQSKQRQPLQPAKKEPDRDKLLREFYTEQWHRHMPKHCENGCGARLIATTLHKAKFFICHIVPKARFESVMVHPMNRWFGCWQCHSVYDSTWTKAVTMPVWPLVTERFTSFMNLIKDTELRYLPDALRILMDNPHPHANS